MLLQQKPYFLTCMFGMSYALRSVIVVLLVNMHCLVYVSICLLNSYSTYFFKYIKTLEIKLPAVEK